jgi:catechol 2,3-dioxygenase-like lactoylglutathione lyase family enzyme
MVLRTQAHWFGVVLNSPDPQALAGFYQRLLGWTLYPSDDDSDFVALAPSEEAGYNLAFQREDLYERPAWPAEPGKPQMQLHLDLEVDSLDEAVAHGVACGAELPEFQPQERVRVMLDPDGHPFCLYVT